MSNVNLKDYQEVLKKIKRPAFQEKHPGKGVAAIRDYLRAKIVLQNLDQTLPVLEMLFCNSGIECVKADTAKMANPDSTGWRFAAFDLRLPNGQIVELYILPKEIQWAKRGRGHKVYEKLRGQKSNSERDEGESREAYEQAWRDYLQRIGKTEDEIKSSWYKTEEKIYSYFVILKQEQPNDIGSS